MQCNEAVSISISIAFTDDSTETDHCYVGGETKNAVKILQHPGVINWNGKNRIWKGIIAARQ